MNLGPWTVRLPNQTTETVSYDALIDGMHSGRIDRYSLISPPAKPEEFRAAGDWPLFWKKFGTTPKRTRGLEEMRHCLNCNHENGLWFDELETLYDPEEDERAFERWFGTPCAQCGCIPKQLIPK